MNISENLIVNLSDLQRISILLAGSDNNKSVKGRLWFQKEIFLIVNNIEHLKHYADFEADYMGPYSESLEEELIQLELDGILKTDNYKIYLTEYGMKISKILSEKIKDKELLNIIFDLKKLLNDLSEDELLAFIYISFPDFTVESTKYEKLKPKLKNIAFRLYKKGKISVGKASEISGLPISNILLKEKQVGNSF